MNKLPHPGSGDDINHFANIVIGMKYTNTSKLALFVRYLINTEGGILLIGLCSFV